MGHQSQFHKNGEIEMGKGIFKANSIASFSTQGRYDLYDIRKFNQVFLRIKINESNDVNAIFAVIKALNFNF